MKYKPKQYAKTLSSLMMETKSPEEAQKIAEKFLKLLEKNGDMKKAKEIITLAENLFIKKTGRRKIILETARRTSKKEFLKSFEMPGDIVEEKIDKDLIAGIKVTINDKQLDLSMRKKLQNIFN